MPRGLKGQPSRTSGPERGKSFHCDDYFSGLLGIGHSTLGKWVRVFSEEAKVPAQDAELLRENERLRKENRILREEREVLKKAAMFFAAQKP